MVASKDVWDKYDVVNLSSINWKFVPRLYSFENTLQYSGTKAVAWNRTAQKEWWQEKKESGPTLHHGILATLYWQLVWLKLRSEAQVLSLSTVTIPFSLVTTWMHECVMAKQTLCGVPEGCSTYSILCTIPTHWWFDHCAMTEWWSQYIVYCMGLKIAGLKHSQVTVFEYLPYRAGELSEL